MRTKVITPPALIVRPGESVRSAADRLIAATVRACGGDRQRAAHYLRLDPKTIRHRLRRMQERDT